MAYLSSFGIQTDKTNPFPFNISAVKFAKNIEMPTPITFIIGDNGTGKSTLLESLAYRLQLPHMNGAGYGKNSFSGARALVPYLKLKWDIERSVGFFSGQKTLGT